MTSVSLPLRDAAGRAHGALVVSELPNGPRLVAGDPLALREGQRYRYELLDAGKVALIEPAELFDFDDDSLRHGRINPGQSVGTLVIAVQYDDGVEASATLEVVPAKLEQTGEYRQMLSDITTHAAEAVLQGFAPTAFNAALATHSTELLYQRFAVLEHHLRSDDFAAAMGQIIGSPHVEWHTFTERRTPGSAYPSGSAFGKALAAAGPRQPWLTGRDRPALATMPTRLEHARHETSPDTAPNRFIKYILETWRALAQQLRDLLTREDTKPLPGPVRRGRQAAERSVDVLDELLSRPLFRQVGTLDQFPSSSQVLQKREGYRQLFHMFMLVEAGLELPWTVDTNDIYSPTLRNTATLYELWCYLTLVDIVGQICQQNQTARAFVPSANGMSLRLNTGNESAIRWQVVRRGRPLEVQLMFNRQFNAGGGSWTASMRPDCSILIRPLTSTPGSTTQSLDVWVHFDAKYRARETAPIDLQVDDVDEPSGRGSAKRDDLLKMHAYRDAIQRTAGSYVLYPGDRTVDRRQFTEMLPGLGAFPLRPGADRADGAEEISTFLNKILDHVADQATQHERDRFWRARIYVPPAQPHPSLAPAPFLDRPPADTDVLLGYVRGSRHREWIEQKLSYNVRADDRAGALRLGSRELSAQLVLLYQEINGQQDIVLLAHAGKWRAVDRQELINSGYPEPRGRLYLVTNLETVTNPPEWLPEITISALKRSTGPRGAPFAATWFDLMSSVRRV